MALTHNPYYSLEPDRGQPDAVQEAYYDHLDAARDRGLSDDEARDEWDRLVAHRARGRGF
jgi:hypothetical protein